MKRFSTLMAILTLLFAGLMIPATASAAPDAGQTEARETADAPAPSAEAPIQTGKSTPRIMVEGFTTTPKPVVAGDDFDIVFTARNMSATATVQNIKFSLSGEGGLLPRSGSTSVYLAKLGPRESVDVTMYYTSLPTLEDKPYPLTLTIDYEDADFTALSSTETVAVVVSQPARVETSVPQVTPNVMTLGGEGSLVFTVNNLGKSAISNVKASIKEGQAVTGSEAYVGNVAAGATANVDMIVQAVDVTASPITLVLSYENSEGVEASLEREVPVTVMEMAQNEGMLGPEDIYEEESTIPWGLIGIGAAVLAAIVIVAVVAVRRHRKKKDVEDEADALSLLDQDGLI